MRLCQGMTTERLDDLTGLGSLGLVIPEHTGGEPLLDHLSSPLYRFTGFSDESRTILPVDRVPERCVLRICRDVVSCPSELLNDPMRRHSSDLRVYWPEA